MLASQQAALQVARGDLVFMVCHECGFVFNCAFDESKLLYGEDYDNTQSHSPYFAHYMADLAKSLVDKIGLSGNCIIEVGCGKGEFLRMLIAESVTGNSGIGFDPSYDGPEFDLGGRVRFNRSFYDETCSDLPEANVVVCRHVIEHVPKPLDLLHAVRQALVCAHSPKVYFETPCVEWILRKRVIWDFFYEHCSLFTVSSLHTAFGRAGFALRSVRHVFGGQYLWLEANLENKLGEIFYNSGDIPALGRQFARAEEQLRLDGCTQIKRLADKGKVAVWGAGAKGTTFVNLVDPENNRIDCVVDLNPNKQGKFVPGTGHPIVGVEMLEKRDVRSAILMNPNYREENAALLKEAGITVHLIE